LIKKIERDKSQIVYNTQGTPMRIVETIDVDYVMVEFLDPFHYKTPVRYFNFLKGTVMNPYDRTICGIGYIGDGKYKGDVRTTPFHKKMNNSWSDMIRRCYYEKDRQLHPTYQNCYVADIWHNFQNYAEWYKENYYEIKNERMHIDKDILYRNNNFYSPETCLIVPQRINMMFMTKSRVTDNDLPQGIHRIANNRFSAGYNTKSLGTYDTVSDAVCAYNKAKYQALCLVADEYKNKIPPKLYEALYNWIPDGANNLKVKEVS
jgi:hypothetical protein